MHLPIEEPSQKKESNVMDSSSKRKEGGREKQKKSYRISG